MMFNSAIQTQFQGDPKLLLLDLDGTLINSVDDLSQATDAMLVALGRPPAGREQVANWVGNGVDKLVRRALVAGDESQVPNISAQQLSQAREYFDQAYLQALTQAAGVYPGVAQWLSLTAAIPKVLITNKARKFTQPLIQSLGWQQHFVELICGDDLAEKKPSPLPLLHACELAAVEPQNALMIGDSRNDVEAARAAKIACVAVTYGYNYGEPVVQANPNWVVDNLLHTLK